MYHQGPGEKTGASTGRQSVEKMLETGQRRFKALQRLWHSNGQEKSSNLRFRRKEYEDGTYKYMGVSLLPILHIFRGLYKGYEI